MAGTNNTGIYDMVSYIRCRIDDIFGCTSIPNSNEPPNRYMVNILDGDNNCC